MSVLPRGTIYRAPTTDTEHEKQKDQCGTGVETIGRLGGAAAAPLGDRPGGVFASAAPQPARREGAVSLFYSVAGPRGMPFLWVGAIRGAEPGCPRRSAAGGNQ